MFTSVKPHMFCGLLTQPTYSNMKDFGKKMFSASEFTYKGSYKVSGLFSHGQTYVVNFWEVATM